LGNNDKSGGKINLIYWFIPVGLLVTLLTSVIYTSYFQDYAFIAKSWIPSNLSTSAEPSDGMDSLIIKSYRNIKILENNLEELAPPTPYIIINTTANRFSLRNSHGDTIRNGLCSTGKDEILIGADKKPYVFKTPRGQFKILKKRTAPVWIKPDWAFKTPLE